MPCLHAEYSLETPLNREPPSKDLISTFLTPSLISYDRNHGPIPHLSATTHSVQVDGLVPHPLRLSIHQLATEFPQHEVVCALECAGNRRHTMRTMLKEVEGIDWGDAAVMNCAWKGPRLCDILRRAGVVLSHPLIPPSYPTRRSGGKDGDVFHVAFSCYQTPCQDDGWFGGSIELEKVMRDDAEMILGLEINGAPLHPNHGYPVRAILPGIVGARWVKWLDRVTVQEQESDNFYQRSDYKVLPPQAVDRVSAEPYWATTPAMCEVPINSVVGVPGDGETVCLGENGKVEVRGYAVPGGSDGPVTRVQVSGDGGGDWVDAVIEGAGEKRTMKWCWVLWRAEVGMKKGSGREVVSRALDAGGN